MARVFVGMSGGVDSSVAAALLVEQGNDVTGVYMKNWSEDLPGMHCPWAEDVADAKRVAVGLGIDFQVFDFQKEYKQNVVDYMIREYQAGRTPNPDVMCNQEVKFKLFLEASLAAGAEYIATGHYARTFSPAGTVARSAPENFSGELKTFSGATPPRATRRADSCLSEGRLFRAHDDNKDQTYFLYRVTSEALAKTMFPLGDFTKAEVRQMAKERGLWTASKKESMGICFVGQVGIREFLSEYVETSPGDIIDQPTGAVVGRHDGAIFYTLGQRHGLNVGGGLPYYVVGKDMAKNEVYVSRSIDDDNLWRKGLTLADVHWINQPPKDGTYHIRVRHRAPLIKAEVTRVNNNDGEKITIALSEPQRAVAPGQSAVIYDGEECLGGGIIC
ncbi:tRNA-specific 2-thiouridylase [Candidatus Saccharibacteria bacterium oral taxon 488]|nr:tRNA-specific 2-thiouridylase [Candidatus Saccharibacteria bacterium oral taxon 488]